MGLILVDTVLSHVINNRHEIHVWHCAAAINCPCGGPILEDPSGIIMIHNITFRSFAEQQQHEDLVQEYISHSLPTLHGSWRADFIS